MVGEIILGLYKKLRAGANHMINRKCEFSPLYWERYFVGEEVVEIGVDRSTRRQMFWRQMQSFRSILIYTS
jgi:hypothetical protein